MAGTYNQGVTRTSYARGQDPLVPDPISAEVIQGLPAASAVLARARRVQMGVNTYRMPALSLLPTAYFVNGDAGMKQTTRQAWKGIDLVVEEIAAIVPIAENYLDDSQVPIWAEVRPRMVEAIGAVIDAACLFGVNKPSTWGTDVYSLALAAGNTVVAGTGDDFAQDVSNLGEKIALDGYDVNGFISRPGLAWKLTGMRSADGIPIYQSDLAEGSPQRGSLYGFPLSQLNNGAMDMTEVELFAGDWSNAMLGVRQDITWKMFDQGVISDDAGNVILNLMQQDSVALRVTCRFAWATAAPMTRMNENNTSRSPFGVVQAATANS